MERVKFGLIGCGRIGKKHIEALMKNKKQYLPVACADPVRDRAETAAALMEEFIPSYEVKTYSDYREMLAKNDLDVVAITTESGFHADIALHCIEQNVHIIMEKPMALSADDCDRVINAAREKNIKGTVCFQNRFNLPVQKLKKVIDEGQFGTIYNGQISVRWNRNMGYYNQAPWRCTWDLDGGALMNQCSHGIDLLQWMLGGKVQSVYGVLRKYTSPREAEDFGSAIVEFENGVVGIIEGTVNVYPRNLEERISVFGEKGTVVIGGVAVNHLETWRFEDEEIEGLKRTDPPNVYGFGHAALYKDFFEAVTRDRQPYITLEEGKKAIEIVLGIYQSMKTGDKVTFPVDFSTTGMKGVFEK